MRKLTALLGLALLSGSPAFSASPEPLTSVFVNTCIKSLGKPDDDLARRMLDMQAPVLATADLGSAMGVSWEKAWQVPSATTKGGYIVATRETSCMVKAVGYQSDKLVKASFQESFGKPVTGLASGLLDSALAKAAPGVDVSLYYKEMPSLNRDALIILVLDAKSGSSSAIVSSLPAGALQAIQ